MLSSQIITHQSTQYAELGVKLIKKVAQLYQMFVLDLLIFSWQVI